jgi:hypothetical protein
VLHEPDAGAARLEWSVHDLESRYLDTLTTPIMTVTQIGEDFLAGTVADELGLNRAVVLPVRPGPPPSGSNAYLPFSDGAEGTVD